MIHVPRAMTPASLGEYIAPKARLADGTRASTYQRTPFVNLLNRHVAALLAGEIDNLGVAAAPRHGKTRILTELTSALFLGTNPEKQVIVASHSARLASKFSKNVRDILLEHGRDLFGVEVKDDQQAADNWGTTAGGGMLAIGVGGSLVGFGADLLIMDDVIADSASALSEVVRNNTLDWYQSTAESRLNSGGKQIFTMQRWHGDDPYQRVVLDNPEDWTSLVIPAIADHDPALGEADPLGRAPGEALWPQKWPIAKLRKVERTKSFWFAAQYQQRPVPRGGGMITVSSIEDNAVRYVPPQVDSRVRYWDRAATENGGDYTAGVLMSRRGDHFYIEDVVHGQWGSTNRDRIIKDTCDRDNARYPHMVVTWAEQEPGSAGKDNTVAFEKMLRPHAAHCQVSTGSKEIRADAMASAFGAGQIHVVRGTRDDPKHGDGHHRGADFSWYQSLVVELTQFPAGKHDDIVDACFPAGTQVRTVLGRRPIESLNPGDLVATRFGFRRVISSGLTNIDSHVISVDTCSGAIIRLTPNHPVYVRGQGFVAADCLAPGDELVSWEQSRPSCIAGSFSDAIRTLRTRITSAISRPGSRTPLAESSPSIGRSGRITTGRSPTDARFTTTTRTLSTTTSGTSSASASPSIVVATRNLTGARLNSPTSPGFDPGRSIGIGATKAGVGTAITSSRVWPRSSGSSGLAINAGSGSSPNADRPGSARRSATPDSGTPAARGWWTRFASSAGRIFAGFGGSRPVRVTAVRGCDGGTRLPVYNLSVEGHPEYFAEGVLVHNCSGAFNKLFTAPEPGGYDSLDQAEYELLYAEEAYS